MKSNKPLSRKNDLLTQEIDGEIMVYDLLIDKAFCLNRTSALVWKMCDGNNSVSEISKGLARKIKSSAGEDLIWFAIEQLKEENLIANSAELENVSFEGMSRRDVIKKVGLGTMIALPIVTGLIAPKAVNASSTCAGYPIIENGTCTASCQCQGRPNGLGGFAPSSCCQISNVDARLVCQEGPPNGAICVA